MTDEPATSPDDRPESDGEWELTDDEPVIRRQQDEAPPPSVHGRGAVGRPDAGMAPGRAQRYEDDAESDHASFRVETDGRNDCCSVEFTAPPVVGDDDYPVIDTVQALENRTPDR